MVEKLNILLDAAVELGKPTDIHVSGNIIQINGFCKGGEKYYLTLSVMEATDDRN